MNIGENIKKYRKEKGLTQSQLSKLSDIPVITLGRYERGERNPSIDILQKISEALKVPINDLYTPKNNETSELLKKLPNNDIGNTLKEIFSCAFFELEEEFNNIESKEEYLQHEMEQLEKLKKELEMNSLSGRSKVGYCLNLIYEFKDIFHSLNLKLNIYRDDPTNKGDALKIRLADEKDGYTKIFDTYEEAELFFNEIKHGIQSSVDRLKYYDKNNFTNHVRDLTALSKNTNPKCNFEVDTIAAHNDHLDEEGEMENITKDLEDMDKWS